MQGIMIDQRDGDRYVTYEEAIAVPAPIATETYSPVSNKDLLEILCTEVMEQYKVDESELTLKLALAKGGQQLYGSLTVDSLANEELKSNASLVLRNSGNRSISVALAGGGNCWVCSNQQISGKVVELRRHTKNIWVDLREIIGNVVYNMAEDFKESMRIGEAMREIPMAKDDSFRMIGLAMGHKVLKPRQAAIAFAELQNPTHDEFRPENAWSLYNHFTEALKRGPAGEALTRHAMADRFLQARLLN